MSTISLFFGFLLLALVSAGIFVKLSPLRRATVVLWVRTHRGWLLGLAIVSLLLWWLWGTLGTRSESLPSSTSTVWTLVKSHLFLVCGVIGIALVVSFAVGSTWAKVLGGLSALALVLLFIIAPIDESVNEPSAPRATRPGIPQSSSLKLDIAAGNSSGLIPPIAGKHPEVTGFGKFSAYAVREDDTVCEADEPSCVNGPLLKGYYVTNKSGKANTYTVVFK